MSDEEKTMGVKENKESSRTNEAKKSSFFEFAKDDNILDRSKRSLARLSWFQKLFK